MIEATAWGRLPRFLIHDRDRVWGGDFVARLAAIGIKSVTTPIRAPNANSIGERVVGSLRRECLDHIIILGERHLSTVLAEFVAYYNHDRPHRTLGLETPVSSVRSLSGEVRSRPILGVYITLTNEPPDGDLDFCHPTGRLYEPRLASALSVR